MTTTDSFDDLEDRVRRRATPAPPPGLRGRVLADMAMAVPPARGLSWRFAAGLAAALLVGLNLAGIAADELATGAAVWRFTPPPGATLTEPADARLGCPWLPCELTGP